jgi:hypothetical protein
MNRAARAVARRKAGALSGALSISAASVDPKIEKAAKLVLPVDILSTHQQTGRSRDASQYADTYLSACRFRRLQYSDKALGLILARRKSPDALVRAESLEIAVRILRTKKDAVSRAREADLIRSSLKDPAPVVRTAATRETVCLDNAQDFVPRLEQIAKSDPADFGPGKADDGGDGDEFYPVRSNARRALREIQNKEGCFVCLACAPRPALPTR